MPPRRSAADRSRYFDLIGKGVSQAEASRKIGITSKTAREWEKNLKDRSGSTYREQRELARMSGPIPLDLLSKEAKAALDDFGYFRRRYMGRIASNWQEDAANRFNTLLWTPQKEYVVLNCPPGGGKSTLLHDIEAWLTCKNRSLRGILGSATQRVALDYTRRLRRTLERRQPVRGDAIEVAAGRELDAETTLAADFGRFQPDNHDVWTQEGFIVAQYEDMPIEEKENTWSAFGLDSTFLGQRVNIAVWDDVVTNRTMKTLESIESMRTKWDDEAETRIEPDGMMALVGQRLNANDLYRYCLDKPAGYDDEEDDDLDEIAEPTMVDPTGDKIPRKYHHFVYKAHDETKCESVHKRSEAKMWPDGCLLDPVRLPWRELKAIQRHRNEKYRVVYQQEDVDPAHVLVPRIWITGGTDPTTNEEFPGCYDEDRGLAQIPNLSGETVSVVTADPSPTMWWSVQWWLYHPDSERRFLLDHARQKMDAPDFLDYNYSESKHFGLLEDWAERAKALGKPIQHLILEKNAAQRFLMQFDHFKRWQSIHGVNVFGHETTKNKSDPEFGVQTIAPHYRYGRIRLPNKSHGDTGFIASRWLVDEVTVWPEGSTDDCVMAHWFLEWWLPQLTTPDVHEFRRKDVPSWMKHAS